MNVLAIDQGTSATKALVVSGDEVLARAEVPVHPRAGPGGAVEQDPGELWESVVEAGRKAVADAGVELDCVGLANQGETVLAWDRATGDAASTAISWQDRRASTVCDRLRGREEELRGITGLPLDPYFAAPKMTWVRETLSPPADAVVTTSDAWLLHRLTGEYVTDAATASRTLLLDLASGQWSADACEAFGFEPDALPRIVDCAGAIGTTAAWGTDVPITAAIVDQQAALLAQACLSPGEGKCTYGTGAFLLVTVGDEIVPTRSGLVECVAWRLRGRLTYCLDGQVYTAGAAVRWLREIGLISEVGDLDHLVAGVADPTAVFVPALAGLAAPFWRPQAKAAFVGLTASTTREDLVAAVIDGIASQVAWLGRAVEEDLGSPLEVLRVDGGLTRSRRLMQRQADLAQTPIEVYPEPDATAIGAASLARLGAGEIDELAPVVGGRAPAATFEPSIGRDEAEEYLVRWRSATEVTMEL